MIKAQKEKYKNGTWSSKGMKTVKCFQCKKNITRFPADIRKINFCSKNCDIKYRSINCIGAKAANWKGGKCNHKGYFYIYSPNHPSKTKDGYVLEHRLVMEKHIGRTLLPTEVVHHINGDGADNRIQNLMLFSSPGTHAMSEHVFRNKFGKFESKKKKH